MLPGVAGPGARGPRRSRGRPPRGRGARAGAARPGRARRAGRSGAASALRRCSTGSASTPLTITTACSSETLAGGHRVPDRFVVVVQRRARAPGGAWRRVWSAGSVLAHQLLGVGGTVVRAEVEAVGVLGVTELELGDPVPQPVSAVRLAVGLGGRERPQSRGRRPRRSCRRDGGDRGRDRVLPGVVECRCHTGNSGIDHRHSRTGNAAFPTAVEKYFEQFLEPSMSCGLDRLHDQGVVGSADLAQQTRHPGVGRNHAPYPSRRCAFRPPTTCNRGSTVSTRPLAPRARTPPYRALLPVVTREQ